MSRTLAGIRGVPFRKIIKREHLAARLGWCVETLACGHKNTCKTEDSVGVTKRRCYHIDCKINER